MDQSFGAHFWSLFKEAETLRQAGRLQEAMQQYASLLLERLSANRDGASFQFTNYDAIIIERLGDLSWLFGQLDTARQLFGALQRIAQEEDNTFLEVYIQIKRSSLAIETGFLEEGQFLLRELQPYIGNLNQIDFHHLQEWEKNIHLPQTDAEGRATLKVRLYYVLGSLLLRLGQYEDCIHNQQHALQLVKQYDSPMIQAIYLPLQLNFSRALLEYGNLTQAEKLLHSIEGQLDRSVSSGNLVNALEQKGKIRGLQGALGESKQYFEEILSLCEANKLYHAAINAIYNLASINISINQVVLAKNLLHKGLQIAELINNSYAINKINSLLLIADLRGSSQLSGVSIMPSLFEIKNNRRYAKRYQDSQIQQIANDIPQTNFYLNYFENKEILFKQLLGYQKWQAADTVLQSMIHFFSHSDSKLILSRIQILQLLFSYYKGQPVNDGQKLIQIKDYLTSQELIPELWEFNRYVSWFQKDTVKEVSFTELQQENNSLLQKMTASLKEEDQAIFLLNKWTAEEENLAAATNKIIRQQLSANKQWFPIKAFQNIGVIQQLNKLLLKLDNYKNLIFNNNINHQSKQWMFEKKSWLQRMWFSKKDTLEIHFLILPDRAFIIYSGYWVFKFEMIAITRIHMRELVMQMHRLVESHNHTRGLKKRSKAMQNPTEALEKLCDQMDRLCNLSSQLATMPKRIKRLVLFPDDVLYGFPFSMLHFQSDFLIKRFSISVSKPVKTAKTRNSIDKSKALLMGLTYEQSNISYLPGIRPEIEGVAQTLLQSGVPSNIMIDEELEKGKLLEQISQHTIVHFACHGVFVPETPDLSGLVLSEKDNLSIRDIWSANKLNTVEHVTLSSCWGADNFILPNKWVISLPEIFLKSGVGSVLGCFWEVDDQVMGKFMTHFYTFLQSYPRDVALQKTQLMALENKLDPQLPQTSEVFLWAGFNLYGSTQQI